MLRWSVFIAGFLFLLEGHKTTVQHETLGRQMVVAVVMSNEGQRKDHHEGKEVWRSTRAAAVRFHRGGGGESMC